MFSKIFPKIHAEGYKFLVIAGIITIIFYAFSNFLALVGLVLTIWVYYFFRDPDRVIINDDNYLVSPADGEVIKVEEVDGPKELGLENKDNDYVDIHKVEEEITSAKRIFANKGWPVIDITRRSVEETASAIMNILSLKEEKNAQEK